MTITYKVYQYDRFSDILQKEVEYAKKSGALSAAIVTGEYDGRYSRTMECEIDGSLTEFVTAIEKTPSRNSLRNQL